MLLQKSQACLQDTDMGLHAGEDDCLLVESPDSLQEMGVLAATEGEFLDGGIDRQGLPYFFYRLAKPFWVLFRQEYRNAKHSGEVNEMKGIPHHLFPLLHDCGE